MSFNLPISIENLLFYYGIVMISLFVFYGVGWLIRRYLFNIKENVSAFTILICSVLGATAIVTIYSIIITKGLTVNWLLLVLFFIFVFYYKKKRKPEECIRSYSLPVWKYLLVIFSINVIFFCYFLYRIADFEIGMFRTFFVDFNFYAKVSQYLNMGYENVLLSNNFFKDIAPQPYHYFELWISALMYKSFGLNALIVYSVSLPMLFDTLIFIALLAIIEVRKKITLHYVLFAFTVLLLSDTIPYLSSMIPIIKGWMPLLESPKLLPVFLFLFTAIILFMHNKKIEAYFTLLAIPVMNMIPIVTIWGTIGVLLLLDYYKNRKIDYSYWAPFLAVIPLYGIYVILSSSRHSVGESLHWGLLRLYITQPIVYFLAYIHLLILIFILDKNKILSVLYKKNRGIVLGIAFFISTTFNILMRPYHYDATQFVTGSITVLVFVLAVVAFLTTITSISLTPVKKIILYCFCLFSLLMSGYDYVCLHLNSKYIAFSKYESTVLKNIPSGHKEYRIGFYIGENVLTGDCNNCVQKTIDVSTIPDVLDYYYNNVYHYSINKASRDPIYYTDNTLFRDYYEKRRKQSPTLSDDDIRIDFIKENKIEYVRIFKNASPSDEFLSKLTLLAEDAICSERFYKVN